LVWNLLNRKVSADRSVGALHFEAGSLFQLHASPADEQERGSCNKFMFFDLRLLKARLKSG
jgi:hypothetical protein